MSVGRGVYITRDEFGRMLDVATSHYRLGATSGGDAARTVTAEQLEAAAGALFEEACGGAAYEALDEGAARTWRVRAAVVLRAAGFTVPPGARG